LNHRETCAWLNQELLQQRDLQLPYNVHVALTVSSTYTLRKQLPALCVSHTVSSLPLLGRIIWLRVDPSPQLFCEQLLTAAGHPAGTLSGCVQLSTVSVTGKVTPFEFVLLPSSCTWLQVDTRMHIERNGYIAIARECDCLMLTGIAGTAEVLLQGVVVAKALPLLSQVLKGPSVRLAATEPPIVGGVGRVGVHLPLLHASLPEQALPHAPQLVMDERVLTQLPLQQLQPAGQALPTAPQFAVSFCRSMHVLLLHTAPELHTAPHAPQLRGSVDSVTQAA
jgi:hypothetical protein